MRFLRLKEALAPGLVVIFLLTSWQLAVFCLQTPSWLLPAPSVIFTEGVKILPRLWINTVPTVEIALLGFVLGILFGLVCALLLHLFSWIRSGFYPLLVLSQNIPIIVLAPLLVIWFGFGVLPKVIIIILVCFFPVAVSTLDGFSQTDQAMLDYMRMIGANRKQLFIKLEFPSALPYIFSGLKISATYSVMGAVIAEWLGSEHGLGVFMTLSSSAFRTDHVFDAIFIIVALSLALLGAIVVLEKIVIRWHPQRKEEANNGGRT